VDSSGGVFLFTHPNDVFKHFDDMFANFERVFQGFSTIQLPSIEPAPGTVLRILNSHVHANYDKSDSGI
jgi:hypothetical protein